MNIGILGIGTFLPPEVRRNDWWPQHVVDQWRAKTGASLVRESNDIANPTEGMLASLKSMSEMANDPFKGAIERRVMSAGMTTSDMETKAAEDALARAGIDRSEIGILFQNSQLPEYLNVPSASAVHHKLGLGRKCITMSIDAACNSFLAQLQLASHMIKGGAARYALLVQSSGVLHVSRPEDQHSAWFGDAATAVIVGPVAEGFGILGTSSLADGSLYEGLVTGCPGSRWYAKERPFLYVPDPKAARRMLLLIADMAKETLDDALSLASIKKADVDFYACHQSTHWFRKVTQEYIGLGNAKSADTFTWTGSLGPANIPFMMATGEREGTLRSGEIVAMHTGGTGITATGTVLRWGGH